jgi:hypothetical protein
MRIRTGVLLCLFPALLPAAHPALLPKPQKVVYREGVLAVRDLSIAFASAPAAEEKFAASQLASLLAARAGRPIRVEGVGAGPRHIVLRRTGAAEPLPAKDEKPGPQSREAYRLSVSAKGVELSARTSAGVFYAAQTLAQLVEGAGDRAALPFVEIEDWPSLAYRGVMMDLSHGGLPTVAEVERQIDFLARWKGNQYYFYSELSIELKGYPLINPTARYSQQQVRRIVAYARQRHVDVVPCLEFYGHLHDLFRLERYADLAALPHGGELNPRNPKMQKMVEDWVAQMAALFPSPWLHIGLDEPWELERAGSAAAGGVEPGQLYLEQLNRVSAWARSHGKRVLFWADVAAGAALFEKYPQLATQLPPDTVPVPWHYNVEKDYNRMLAPFSKAKVPQVVGTGIWAWDTIAPDYHVTFQNIDGFLADGKRHGTLGIVNTNWSDDAQILYRTTLPGIAYGAAASWQESPLARDRFFADYAALYYDPRIAADVGEALTSLTAASRSINAALGGESMFRLWDDPLAPERLARVRGRLADLRQARLSAEDAQERLLRAIATSGDTFSLPSLLLAAKLIDYAGMKFLYAVEIADAYAKFATSRTRSDLYFWTDRQAASRNHSRMSDLMDLSGELREEYRKAWLQEFAEYRLAAALGRFDGELQYWRRLQARFWELKRTFREKAEPPTLESLRPQ